MNEGLLPSDREQKLRRLAERKLRQLEMDAISGKSPEEVRQLIHELQVHQVELEMQQDELYETTNALRESEVRYRTLYQFAPNGYFTLNAQGGIVEINFAAARFLSIERSMILGKLLRTFISAASRPVYDDFFYTLQSHKDHQRCEISMVSLSGEQLTLFLEGVQVAEDQAAKTTYLIVAIDMTARKKAELSIQTQSILLQKVFNTAFTGLAVLDTVRSAQGEIVDFTYRLTNSVIERMAGQNLLGQSCLELYPELQTMGLFEKMKEVADTGQSVDIEQNYQVNSNTYWFRITIVPIPDGVVAGVEDITSRKRIEKENMQLRLQRQKELLHAILDAQEEERRRISESLHNGVGQILYATKLNLDQINVDTLPLSAEQLKLAKLKTEQLLIEAIKETRHVSHELIPLLLDEYGLAVAMADFCKRFSHTGLHLACYGLEERLPKQVEMVIYRIAQELVNNIVKHAQATRARIEVYRKKGRIIIEAQDNGKGFVLKQAENGIGLRTIYDRTKLFDGKVEIESSLGKGTLITVSFPLTIVKEDM